MKRIVLSLVLALFAGNVIADDSTTPIAPTAPRARINGISEIPGLAITKTHKLSSARRRNCDRRKGECG
jgi:hypothetical protein